MSKRNFIIASAVVLALATTTAALAAGEGGPIQGGVRNPSPNESQALTAETQIIADSPTYGTRQSNKSDNGGGAIYGCRSGAGGTAKGNEPCVRANNLSSGLAFEFVSEGNQVGLFDVRNGGDNARPFTTNATGVATGLNADRVDGMNASEIVAAAAKAAQSPTQTADPFVQVAANGAVVGSRGLVDSNPVVREGAGDRVVTFTGDVSKCAFTTALESTDPGTISITTALATDKKTTKVEVRTYSFTQTGATGSLGTKQTDLAFHLAGTC